MIIHRNYTGLSMKNKRNDKGRNDKLTGKEIILMLWNIMGEDRKLVLTSMRKY